MKFRILQIKDIAGTDYAFRGYMEDKFNIEDYEVTYEATSFLRRLFAMEEDSIMVAPGAKGCYISNLTNGTEYAFTVKSVDTSGNKSAGVTKTITPSIIEKSALQISLEPNTTERTNQDVVITVNFDKKIMEVSKEIQDKIQTTIKDMTDMDVIAVNVRVAGVNEAPEA